MITALLLVAQIVMSTGDTASIVDTLGLPSGKGKSDSPIVFTETSVVGIRADEKTPISQKTLNKTQIQKHNFGQEMPYQLGKTPSVIFQSDNGLSTGYSYFRLRGIDQTRINFTLNGMPLNEPEDQGAYFSNYTDFMNNINSVQIQRGVGISTNGVASYGGSVNLEFESLTDTTTSVEVGYGSYNTKRVTIGAHSGLKNNLAAYFRASKLSTDGYRYNSGNNSWSLFGNMGYISDNDIIQFIAISGFETSKMAYLATSIDDINIDPRTNYLTSDEIDKFSQSVYQLQYTHKMSDENTFTLQTYYNTLRGNYGVLIDTMYNFNLNSYWFGAIGNLSFVFDNVKLYTGLHVSTYKRNHFLNTHPLDNYIASIDDNIYFNSGIKKEASLFTKAMTDFGPLTVFADIQYRTAQFKYRPDKDYGIVVRPVAWKFVNLRYGLNFLVAENITLYSSMGTTSREPTRNDMFAGYDDLDSSNIGEIGEFNRVKPEQVTNIEVGTNVKLNDFTIQANVYNMQFKNEIAAIGKLSYIGLPLRKNVPSSYRRGIEVDAQYDVLPSLKFQSNVAYITAKIEEYKTDYNGTFHNVTPLLTPKWISNSSINYVALPFEFIFNERWVSESYLDNQNTLTCPSYFVSDLATKIYINNLDFTFRINNVFNRRYYTSGYVVNNTPYYFIQSNRNFFVSLSLFF